MLNGGVSQPVNPVLLDGEDSALRIKGLFNMFSAFC